jgi:hypothetical protein
VRLSSTPRGGHILSQLKDLEGNPQNISGVLKRFNDTTVERIQETRNLVVHVLAIEAIFTVMPRTSLVNFEAVSALIKKITSQPPLRTTAKATLKWRPSPKVSCSTLAADRRFQGRTAPRIRAGLFRCGRRRT